MSCERCGEFEISSTVCAILGDPSRSDGLLKDEAQKASVGHWLQLQQRYDESPFLTADTVERLAESPWFPSLRDQLENLLKLTCERSDGPGRHVQINTFLDQFIVGAKYSDSVDALIDQLKGSGWLDVLQSNSDGYGNSTYRVSPTFDGWLIYEDLLRGHTSGRTACITMPFNKPDLDSEWLPKLRDAVKETGFDLLRNDDVPEPGLIDVRMRLQIKEARFLIVELTHENLGAYWEAGFAEGLGKPVIYTCCEGVDAHFDVDHSLRIEWHPDRLDLAAERVKATIRNSLPDALREAPKD